MQQFDSTEQVVISNESKPEKAKKKPSLVRSAIILYVALVILALGVTVGWFSINTHVFIENETPGNIQIQVSSGDLKISIDDSAFADRIELTSPVKSYYIDISGNGEKLYFPKSLDANAQPFLADSSTFIEVTGNNQYYIDMRISFQTTSQMNVYLSNLSEITGAEGFTNQVGANAYSRKSMYGNIGCDAIVGAARVAFLEPVVDEDTQEETLVLKQLWIPNDNIALVYENGEAKIYTDSAHRESKVRGYSYITSTAGTMQQIYYTADDYANGEVAVSVANLADATTGMINQSIPLVSFEKVNELQTKSLVIRVWFEGTDREADQALNGGEAKYLLSFVGINKDECSQRLATMQEMMAETVQTGDIGIYYNTSRSTLCFYSALDAMNTQADTAVMSNYILYSLDGIDWRPYSSTTGSTLVRKETEDYDIYIRIAETSVTKPGNIVKVTIPKNPPPPEESTEES